MGPNRVSKPLHLSVLAAKSEKYTTAAQHLQPTVTIRFDILAELVEIKLFLNHILSVGYLVDMSFRRNFKRKAWV